MDKNVILVGLFLAAVFGMTVTAHLTFVAHNGEKATGGIIHETERGAEGAVHGEREMTVYATQAGCEEATGDACELQLCDNIPAGESFEDTCGEGFKEGWLPKAH